MTPEQLEELPGVGPKTIEKISIAVNNYFSALEAGEGQGVEPGTEAQEGVAVDAAPDELQGENIELPNVHVENSEYQEATDTGQALEAAEIAGVDNAPAADVSEVHVHGEDPVPEAEEVSAPEELQPEETSKPENLE
jgi:N utilization substance protein A